MLTRSINFLAGQRLLFRLAVARHLAGHELDDLEELVVAIERAELLAEHRLDVRGNFEAEFRVERLRRFFRDDAFEFLAQHLPVKS